MHLGDIIDGKNPAAARESALADITAAFDALGKRTYHMIGNHWCTPPAPPAIPRRASGR